MLHSAGRQQANGHRHGRGQEVERAEEEPERESPERAAERRGDRRTDAPGHDRADQCGEVHIAPAHRGAEQLELLQSREATGRDRTGQRLSHRADLDGQHLVDVDDRRDEHADDERGPRRDPPGQTPQGHARQHDQQIAGQLRPTALRQPPGDQPEQRRDDRQGHRPAAHVQYGKERQRRHSERGEGRHRGDGTRDRAEHDHAAADRDQRQEAEQRVSRNARQERRIAHQRDHRRLQQDEHRVGPAVGHSHSLGAGRPGIVAPCQLIGVRRFELRTSPSRTERATRLRHTPSARSIAEHRQATGRIPQGARREEGGLPVRCAA